MARRAGRTLWRDNVWNDGFRLRQAESAPAFIDPPRHAPAAGGAIPDELFRAIHDLQTRGRVSGLSARLPRLYRPAGRSRGYRPRSLRYARNAGTHPGWCFS